MISIPFFVASGHDIVGIILRRVMISQVVFEYGCAHLSPSLRIAEWASQMIDKALSDLTMMENWGMFARSEDASFMRAGVPLPAWASLSRQRRENVR
jgi:hypothetical protein